VALKKLQRAQYRRARGGRESGSRLGGFNGVDKDAA